MQALLEVARTLSSWLYTKYNPLSFPSLPLPLCNTLLNKALSYPSLLHDYLEQWNYIIFTLRLLGTVFFCIFSHICKMSYICISDYEYNLFLLHFRYAPLFSRLSFIVT